MTSPTLYTAHDVPDLFNLLPALFGFAPEDSICAIGTTGPRHRMEFSMRVDLPEDASHARQVGRFVAGHLRTHGAEGAIVLVLSSRTTRARQAALAVERALAPVRPVVVAWSDGAHYWTADAPGGEGTPLEISPHHQAVVEAVVAGREVLPDRAALEERWRPVEGPATAWLVAQVPQVEREIVEQAWRAPGDLGLWGVQEVGEVVAAVERQGVDALDARSLLRVGVWLTLAGVRDRLWPLFGPDDAARLLPAWREVARRAPGAYAAVPYTFAAYLAYLQGEGAQAAIGLERARRADPGYTMAATLEEALQAGTRPGTVHEIVQAAFAPRESWR